MVNYGKYGSSKIGTTSELYHLRTPNVLIIMEAERVVS